MPGLLRPDARCPHCDNPLDGLVDTTNSEGVTRELFHSRVNGKRPKPCKINYVDHALAADVRMALETPRKKVN